MIDAYIYIYIYTYICVYLKLYIYNGIYICTCILYIYISIFKIIYIYRCKNITMSAMGEVSYILVYIIFCIFLQFIFAYMWFVQQTYRYIFTCIHYIYIYWNILLRNFSSFDIILLHLQLQTCFVLPGLLSTIRSFQKSIH